MCSKSRGASSRVGLLWGLSALAALIVALVSGSWLYTKEPVTLPNSQVSTFVSFRIGLWRVCPYVKRVNSTIHVPSPSCTLVKYSGWDDVHYKDLGVWTTLDLAQVFISRMRSCAILCGSAAILILLALVFAVLGLCHNDSKTIIACGLFILGGLALGTGLVIFVSSLSETLLEISQYHKEPPDGPLYDYRYGWCFYTAGVAFILTNMAAVFTLSGYLNRFPSVDEMVRVMVPGAERKLREHQHLSNEYLVKLTTSNSRQYEPLPSEQPTKYEAECSQLLNKTPPDVCTTNKCPDFVLENLDPGNIMTGVIEPNYSVTRTLAGQTVPITIKNHNSTAPLSCSNLPMSKYGTMHYPETVNRGFLGDIDGSATSSSGYYKSKTLQHPKNKKMCVKIETFQVPEASLEDFNNKRTNDFGYSGSAV